MNSGGSRKRSDLVNNQGDSNDWIRNMKPVILLINSQYQESENKKKKNRRRIRKPNDRRREGMPKQNENKHIIKHTAINMPKEEVCLTMV